MCRCEGFNTENGACAEPRGWYQGMSWPPHQERTTENDSWPGRSGLKTKQQNGNVRALSFFSNFLSASASSIHESPKKKQFAQQPPSLVKLNFRVFPHRTGAPQLIFYQ